MAARPTPYSIAFAALISLHSQERSPLYHTAVDAQSSDGEENNNNNNNTATTTDDAIATASKVDEFIQDCLLESHRKLLSTIHGAPSIRGLLHKLQQRFVGQPIAFVFHCWLKVASASIDHVMDFMMDLQRSLQNGTVDAESANGVFLRSVCAGFDQLSFESVSLLWNEFHYQVNYIKITAKTVGSINDNHLEEQEGKTEIRYSHSQQQQQQQNNNLTTKQEWPLSPDQMEEALQYEIRHGRDHDTLSATTTGNRQFQLRKILEHNPELPSAHFLHFTQALEAGERETAVDALHPYLDYALVFKGEPEILQFAAILAASMYRMFGDHAMSLAATEEVVRVAQQSQDAACVAFALGWLSIHETDHAAAEELIRRCVQRAMEGNLTSLAAGASMMLARMSINTKTPAVAWTHLIEATTDETTSAVETGGSLDRPTRMNHVRSGEDALAMFARQRMVAAGIWDAYGQPSMAALSALTALQCHADQLLSEDVASAIQNIAKCSLFGFSSETVKGGLEACIQKYLIESGQTAQFDTAECIYGQSIRMIIELRQILKLPVNGVILPEVGLILHEWAVRRGDYAHAEMILDGLESCLCPRLANFEEVRVDVLSQKCFLLSRQERWEEAKHLTKQLVEICKKNQFRNQHAKLLLILSKIHLDSCRKQFTYALPSLFECLNAAEAYQMDGLHAAALSLLAEVHLRMNNPKRAIALIRAAFPSILQHEAVWVQAESYLTLAKCHVHEGINSSAAKTKTTKRQKNLEKAYDALKRSEELFERCHDRIRLKEVLYLQAHVLNEMPKSVELRNKAASKFVKMSQSLQEGYLPCLDGFVNAITDRNQLTDLASRPLLVAAVK